MQRKLSAIAIALALGLNGPRRRMHGLQARGRRRYSPGGRRTSKRAPPSSVERPTRSSPR